MSSPNFVNGAAGTIATSVFVVIDTSSAKAVNQASSASVQIIGISSEYAQNAPLPNASTVAATSAGDPIKVFTIGDVCLLNSSTAGWTAGDRLTANAAGFGIASGSGNYYGAIALTTMTGLGLGQVQVILGKNA